MRQTACRYYSLFLDRGLFGFRHVFRRGLVVQQFSRGYDCVGGMKTSEMINDNSQVPSPNRRRFGSICDAYGHGHCCHDGRADGPSASSCTQHRDLHLTCIRLEKIPSRNRAIAHARAAAVACTSSAECYVKNNRSPNVIPFSAHSRSAGWPVRH